MSIDKTYSCLQRKNVNLCLEHVERHRRIFAGFVKTISRVGSFSAAASSVFSTYRFGFERWITYLVSRGKTIMKRMLSLFAAVVLFAAAGAAGAAETSGSQPATCQGPASQCNVFFGH
jgi:hypothetical protein